MDNYKRIYELLIEGWMSDKDLEQYKGRPSRKKKPTRASKKTQAAMNRANKKEARSNIKALKSGTYKQQRGKE